MPFISTYSANKKNLFVRCSQHDLDVNLHYLQNINESELLDVYNNLKYKLLNEYISLGESEKIWKSYCSEIIIFYCIQKLLLDIDIPFVKGLNLPYSNPY